MPMEPQGAMPVDPGNGLLGECPATMTTAMVQTPAGQRLALTIRTPSSTTTVFLGGKDAQAWAAQLTRESGQMSTSGLVAANGHLNGGHGG